MRTGLQPGSKAPSGVVFLDKARGVSSFAALAAVKRAVGTRKVGHTGTLDPFATGMLLALVGPATRCARYFNGLSKDYLAVVRFGSETDTDDATGAVVRSAALPSEDRIRAAIDTFRGTIDQVPPAYSAVHVNGRRAHEIARTGQAPAVRSRRVEVHRLEVQDVTGGAEGVQTIALAISCSAGTYVRSIARDLGRFIDSAAHAQSLRRTGIGPFTIDLAVPSETVDGVRDLRGLASVLAHLPGIGIARVPPGLVRDVVHGRPVSAREIEMVRRHGEETADLIALVCDEQVLAVGPVRDGLVRYDMVLVPGDVRG